MKTWDQYVQEDSSLLDKVPNSYIHKAAPQFRNQHHGSVSRPGPGSWYVINAMKDGWFRISEKQDRAYGYGLEIKNVRLSGRDSISYGEGRAYKVLVDYTNSQGEPEKNEPFWLYVHSEHTPEEVLQYIEKHKHNWKA